MGISTHVLDVSRGRPAAGVRVVLECRRGGGEDGDGWRRLGHGATDDDGRVTTLLPEAKTLEAGVHRLTFYLGEWFAARDVEAFYPQAVIVFEVREPEEHHHVPLLLSPFGYSTYRGS
ncbi:MAG TPA: hydroxyisourate hydrolase [Thermoanaerobaculia bacterium]|nr:hydroxyisourate hydrolase [Thermoanaerobaculia bacterium]